MIDSEKLIGFFRENSINESHNTTWIRNFYTIFNILNDQEYFKEFIKGEYAEVRNPYKSVYPLKLNSELKKNLSQRIKGSIYIKDVNKEAKHYYCNAVIAAAVIFYKMGYKFSEDEIARIKECCHISKKLSKSTEIENLFDIYTSEIYNISNNIECSEEECKEYREDLKKTMEILNSPEKTREYIYKGVRNGNMEYNMALEDILVLIMFGRVNFNENANKNCSKVYTVMSFTKKGITSAVQISEHEGSFSEIDEDFEADEEFLDEWKELKNKEKEYNNIINDILEKSFKECKDKKDLPYYLYQNLNNTVVYNTIAFSWDQRNPRLQEILANGKIEDINAKRKQVTCHTWSRAMLDLLARAGYEAYIVGKNGHQFVLFFDEEHNAYVADGTDPAISDRPNWFKGADIARSKLGIFPANFYQVLGYDEYLRPNDVLYQDGEFKRESKIEKEQIDRKEKVSFNMEDLKKENGGYDFKAVFKFIDENPSFISSFGNFISERCKEEGTIDVINEIIKELIKGNEDDDLLLTTCVNNLIYILKNQERNNIKNAIGKNNAIPVFSINNSNDLYKKVENRTKIVPLIYIRGKNGLEYYIWDDENGFIKMDKKEILDKINSGVYHSSKNSGSAELGASKYILPGLRSPKKSLEEEEEAIFGRKEEKNLDIFWEKV